MRNTFLLLVLIICFGEYSSGFASVKKPKKKIALKVIIRNLKEVELCAQISTDLCWAASIKMVSDYLEHSEKYSLNKIAKTSPLATGTSDTERSVYAGCAIPNNCTDTTCYNLLNQDALTSGLQRDLESILSRLGYYANTDTLKLDWKIVKKQIDNCHPFLLTIYDSQDSDKRHMVVVKGYWTRGNNKYLIIYDPWGNCIGQKYSLPFEILYEKESPNRVYNFTININQKDFAPCISCGKRRIDTRFSQGENAIHTAFSLSSIPFIKVESQLNNNQTEGLNLVEVKTISSIKLKNDNIEGTNNIYEDLKIIDVIIDEHTVVRFAKFSDGKYKVVKILQNDYEKQDGKYPSQYLIYPKLHQGFFVRGDKVIPQYNIGNIYIRNRPLAISAFPKSLKEIDIKINQNTNRIMVEKDLEKVKKILMINENKLNPVQLRNAIPSSVRIILRDN